MEWKQEPVDLYDCRMRSWYIEAANSAKDIIVLVDNSGSMMGQRKEIAKHVVSNILDTLGSNDYVNVFSIQNDTEEVVDCFAGRLVQVRQSYPNKTRIFIQINLYFLSTLNDIFFLLTVQLGECEGIKKRYEKSEGRCQYSKLFNCINKSFRITRRGKLVVIFQFNLINFRNSYNI